MREAPAVVIINELLAAGATVKTYDPVAMHEAERDLGNTVTYAKDSFDALIDADALLIVTEWPEFRYPNFAVMAKLMKNQVIFDGRNIYEPKELKENGFTILE
jgi:Predicted UDP-glucose 6-dehydrogenase